LSYSKAKPLNLINPQNQLKQGLRVILPAIFGVYISQSFIIIIAL